VALREQVVQHGETVVIDDVTRDKRIADAALSVQSLIMVPLKFGDQVIGTLELEHHKRKTYRSKDVVTIATFANQLATAIHITELRRPSSRRSRRSPSSSAPWRGGEGDARSGEPVAQSTGIIREGAQAEREKCRAGWRPPRARPGVAPRVGGRHGGGPGLEHG